MFVKKILILIASLVILGLVFPKLHSYIMTDILQTGGDRQSKEISDIKSLYTLVNFYKIEFSRLPTEEEGHLLLTNLKIWNEQNYLNGLPIAHTLLYVL